jgi:hypothetical protein
MIIEMMHREHLALSISQYNAQDVTDDVNIRLYIVC